MEREALTTLTKCCVCCKTTYPATKDNFSRKRDGKYGLRAVCLICERAKAAEYRRNVVHRLTTEQACSRCKVCKPVSEFSPAKTKVSGYHNVCKACRREMYCDNPEPIREKIRLHRINHPEQYLARDHAYYHKDPKARAAHKRELRAMNPEHDRALQRKRYAANPNPAREASRKRRAIKLGSKEHATQHDIDLQYKSQKGLCWWCGIELEGKFHVDHRIPLSKGGNDSPGNIVISCPHCNLSKNSKLSWEWNGRLV